MKSAIFLLPLLALTAPAAAAASTPPIPIEPIGSLISQEDYPADALEAEAEGSAVLGITVGTNGKVAACTVTESSGSVSLDAASCRIITERARFTPAKDRKGRPVRGTFSQRITWRMEPKPVSMVRSVADLWGYCLGGEVAKDVITDRPADQVADAALKACSTIEAFLVARFPTTLEQGQTVETLIETMRQEFRRKIADELPKDREGFRKLNPE